MIIRLTVFFLLTPLLNLYLWAEEVSITPEVLRQGDVVLIRITATDKTNLLPNPPSPPFGKGEMVGFSDEDLRGSFMDKKLHFFMTESGDYMALAGIDMKTTPGEYPLSLFYSNEKMFEGNIKILPASVGIQKLTLPKEIVDLTPERLKRIEIEQSRLVQLWPVINEKLWDGKFIMPIKGRIKGSFGVRRIINEEERSPHSGIDIEAGEGDPVVAPNRGRVVLIDDQFFGGKTLVLDHGYGIYSIFYHLSKITVSEDQLINRGDLVGHAGSTGRATGPHLHWGVRLQGERINPISIINLEMD